MFCTKSIISNISEVPIEWVYFYYLECDENYDGSSYKVVSPFLRGNKKDKDASLGIFVKNNEYRWTDFGLGEGGSYIDLVKKMFNLTYAKATNKILEDYNNFIITGGECNFKSSELRENKVLEIKETNREWNTNDKAYWTKYHLGSKDLNNTRAISEYTMVKGDREVVIKGEYIYGFYTEKGELYKIYQPLVSECKYLTVKNHIGNSDKEKKYDYLAIVAGKKDDMAFNKLKLHVDTRIPMSENSIISESIIKEYKKIYKRVIVIFDSDDAGIKAMKKYKEKYDLDFIVLPEKDIAELVKNRGVYRSRDVIAILINKKINDLLSM